MQHRRPSETVQSFSWSCLLDRGPPPSALLLHPSLPHSLWTYGTLVLTNGTVVVVVDGRGVARGKVASYSLEVRAIRESIVIGA